MGVCLQRTCCVSGVAGAVVNGAVVVIAVASEQASHLPLQMLLYFNGFYFPCWWLSTVFMLDIKVSSWTQLKKDEISLSFAVLTYQRDLNKSSMQPLRERGLISLRPTT